VLELHEGYRAVAVFGGRHPAAGEREYEQACKLGALLAAAGYMVMSGGYSGVMEAVSRGASQAGGIAVGVTMEIFRGLKPNPFLSREIRTRDFFHRLEFLTTHASAFIALRGGMGTLTEMSLVWNMMQTGTIHDKPMILVGDFWRPLLRSIAGHLVIRPEDFGLFHYADTVDEAVARLTSMHSPLP